MYRHFMPAFFLPLLMLSACQPAPVSEPRRLVSVSGEGEISVAPEIATVRLAIDARNRDLAAAQQKAGETVAAVLALVDEIGIPREAVQSTQLHVQPEYDWHEGEQRFRGYLVHREIRVELEDLSKLGPLLERALSAGVNNVGAPELDVKDARKLHREVLRLAAADARANAEALAETLDATLGEARRISAVESGPPVPMARMEQHFLAADAKSAEDSYESGRIVVRANVQAEFELR